MRLPAFSRAALGPLLLIILIIGLAMGHKPLARSRLAPQWAMPQTFLANLAWPAWPVMAPASKPFAQPTGLLELQNAEKIYSASDQAALKAELEQALTYSAKRFGSEPKSSIQTTLKQDANCALHGVAYTDQREIQVFTCAKIARQRVVNLAAHEFIHQLAQDRYGLYHLQADKILAEGLATWGAGKYWLGGQPDFAAFVRRYQRKEQLLPLKTSVEAKSSSELNKLYYEWASFVEFLLQTYGREKFDALYQSGSFAPGSAAYQEHCGKDLAALERAWQAWLYQN